MGREERDSKTQRMAVLESVRGHDSSLAHSWGHTNGLCPKCGCQQQQMFFCDPVTSHKLPRLAGCELDGEHVHRMCASCHYPWIERPLDHTALAEQRGEVAAESELAAMLAFLLDAFLLDRGEPVTIGRVALADYRGWVICFERDPASDMIGFSVRPPEPQTGEPVHPSPGDAGPVEG